MASMKAAPKLRNRVVREFNGKCMTNHAVEKAVTSLQAKRPVEPERLPVGPAGAEAALIYEREKPQTRKVYTVLEYFACLRLIMGTYAYCGTDLVPSQASPGTTVEFFSWEVAIGYADDVLHKCLEISVPEHARLRWLRLRDERTRAQMGHLINQGMPGGEALTQAWKEHAHLWDMEDKVTVAETQSDVRTRTSPPPKRRQIEDRRPPPRGDDSRIDMRGVKMASMDKNKRKFCGAWNGRGCSEPCPKKAKHACSIIENGKICGSTNHNAVDHVARK